MTPLHKLTKAYWDAFYTGMMAVGLRPEERPAFRVKGDTESETMRCMRVAMETLKNPTKEALVAGFVAVNGSGPYYSDYETVPEEDIKKAWQDMLAVMFPEPIASRKKPLTGNDMAIKDRAKRKFD